MEPIKHYTPSVFDRFNAWLQESIMVKLLSIGFLLLILLIPANWIEDVIYERQGRANDVMNEVASKWSGAQTLAGPVLVIPFKRYEVIDRGKDGKEVEEMIDRAFFLPESLNITSQVTPTELRRGIFDAVVYSADVTISSNFSQIDFGSLDVSEENILWNKAFVAYGISDLRGIKDVPVIKVGEASLSGEPSGNIGISVTNTTLTNETSEGMSYSSRPLPNNIASSGIIAELGWQDRTSFTGNFNLKLALKGSKHLQFVPTGKTTDVQLAGAWSAPSFDGEFLPITREVNDAGFKATWKILHFNRPFSQQWTGESQHFSGSQFGVNLLVPVDQYQKSIRTAKYGSLIILLTFIALFLVELTQNIRIHPFQYILIGAALIIYYTLLLSISEHFGYNTSYIISSSLTIALIGLYSGTFLKTKRLIFIFISLLIGFYTFIFVIVQEQDFSLLLGSVGLFLIVGTLMYFSRKIDWYRTTQPA